MLQKIKLQYNQELKRIKKKKFMLKAKLILTVILPVFIILLFIKVTKTFVQIKIRKLFTTALPQKEISKRPAKPIPAKKIPVEKEIIQPLPVHTNL